MSGAGGPVVHDVPEGEAEQAMVAHAQTVIEAACALLADSGDAVWAGEVYLFCGESVPCVVLLGDEAVAWHALGSEPVTVIATLDSRGVPL